MKIDIYYTDLIPTPNFEKKEGKEIEFSDKSSNRQYKKVWTGTEADFNLIYRDDWQTLEAVFSYMNLRQPVNFTQPFRSLSIGDVISLDGRFYVCQTLIWRQLDQEEINHFIHIINSNTQ